MKGTIASFRRAWKTKVRAQYANRSDALRLRAVRSAVAVLWSISVLAIVAVVVGMAVGGPAFITELVPYGRWLVFGLLGLAVLLAATSAYLVWLRDEHSNPGRRLYRHGPRLRVAALAVLVVYLALALVLIAGVLQSDGVLAGPVRPGHIGVAVGEFTSGAGLAASEPGRELSIAVARDLRREIRSRPELRDRVSVVSAPLVRNDEEARDFAARNGIQVLVWGRMIEGESDAFIPSVAIAEPANYQFWYGDVPAAPEAPLTDGRSTELGIIRSDETSDLTAYLLGLVYLQRNDLRQAAADLQRAIDGATRTDRRQAAKSLAVFHLALGRVHARLGDAAGAAREYRLALRQDPDFAGAYVGLGNLGYEQGDCVTALSAYDRAVDLAPLVSDFWYARGNAHFCLQSYDSAARDYREAIRLSQSAEDSLNLYRLVLGVTLCQSGRTEEGVTELELLVHTSSLLRSAETETETCLKLAATESSEPELLSIETPSPVATHQPPPFPLAAWSRLGTESRDLPFTAEPFLVIRASDTPPASPAITAGPSQTLQVGASATPTSLPAGWAGPTRPSVTTPTPQAVITLTDSYPSLPVAAPGIDTPRPTLTEALPTTTIVPPPSLTPTLESTWTPLPAPTRTSEPAPTWTPLPPPTATPEPAPTWTPLPPPTVTQAPEPTSTPLPPDTPTPEPQPTVTPPLPPDTPTPEPEATPEQAKPKPTRHPRYTPQP